MAVGMGGAAVGLEAGAVTAMGSLPHLDARAAAEWSLKRTPLLPFIPQLPRRSVHEYMIPMALSGESGITVDSFGQIHADAELVDADGPGEVDLGHESFGGLRAFLDVARARSGPVKWQLAGPVTVGLALHRAGLDASLAFVMAARVVQERLASVGGAVRDALPEALQVVVLDEPGFVAVMDPEFPIGADDAIDLTSRALASIDHAAITGVHCCGDADWSMLTSAGATMLSLPPYPSLVRSAGALAGHFERGGWVLWGAVPTDRPLGTRAEHWWRDLEAVWTGLVDGGCATELLLRQSMFSPACGLAMHDLAQVDRVMDLTSQIAERAKVGAAAFRRSDRA